MKINLSTLIITSLAIIYGAIIHTWLSKKDKREIEDIQSELAG